MDLTTGFIIPLLLVTPMPESRLPAALASDAQSWKILLPFG
jgi:hypothetical protein